MNKAEASLLSKKIAGAAAGGEPDNLEILDAFAGVTAFRGKQIDANRTLKGAQALAGALSNLPKFKSSDSLTITSIVVGASEAAYLKGAALRLLGTSHQVSHNVSAEERKSALRQSAAFKVTQFLGEVEATSSLWQELLVDGPDESKIACGLVCNRELFAAAGALFGSLLFEEPPLGVSLQNELQNLGLAAAVRGELLPDRGAKLDTGRVAEALGVHS